MSSVSRRIQVRRDTADNWTAVNPILAEGEIGYETTGFKRMKVGDGRTRWAALAYFNIGPTGRLGPTGPIGLPGVAANTGATGPTGVPGLSSGVTFQLNYTSAGPIVYTTVVSTLAGSDQGLANNPGTAARFSNPSATAVDSSGTVYVVDTANNCIRRITSAGLVTTFAGDGAPGAKDGSGSNAQFNSPSAITITSAGILYVSDAGNHRIRRITSTGVVSTFAGSTSGFQDGIGTNARFDSPQGIVVDSLGNVYVADANNHRIRIITSAGQVSTFAGQSTSGITNDLGTSARFNTPTGLAIDSAGTLYVADKNNHRIRKVTPQGSVSTLAGSTVGFTNNTGTAAQFSSPVGIAVDSTGTVYVADTGNHRIRTVTSTGVVTTFVGLSTSGSTNGSPSVTQFSSPYSITVGTTGVFYVADYGNHRIRKIVVTASDPNEYGFTPFIGTMITPLNSIPTTSSYIVVPQRKTDTHVATFTIPLALMPSTTSIVGQWVLGLNVSVAVSSSPGSFYFEALDGTSSIVVGTSNRVAQTTSGVILATLTVPARTYSTNLTLKLFATTRDLSPMTIRFNGSTLSYLNTTIINVGPTGATGPHLFTIFNKLDHRIITSITDKSDQLLANSNLTFNGSNLNVVNTVTTSNFRGQGTVALPPYAFTGDVTSGMFLPTESNLAFTTAGVERMRITTGNVGIATPTPAFTLDVSGTANVSGNLSVGSISTSGGGFSVPGNLTGGIIRSSSNGTAALPAYTFSNDLTTGTFLPTVSNLALTTAGVERVRILPSGNVGIATPTPGFTLDVSGTANVSGNLSVGTISTSGGGFSVPGNLTGGIIRSSSNGTASQPVYTFSNDLSSGLFIPFTSGLGFATAGRERMTITSSGRVGIGNSDPINTLDVTGNASVSSNLTGAIIRTSSDGTASAPAHTFSTDLSTGVFLPTASNLALTTAGVERMRILPSGNVGVGIAAPTERLHVSGNAIVTGTLTAGATTVSSLGLGSGAITTTGSVSAGSAAVTGTLSAGATTVTSLAAGSGAITTTGTLSGGATTVTSLAAGDVTVSSLNGKYVMSVLNSSASNFDNGVSKDENNTIYFTGNGLVRSLTQAGVLTTITSQVTYPRGVAYYAGSLYITDNTNNNIRKLVISTGVLTVFAGSTTGESGYNDAPGTSARFYNVRAITVDSQGNLYLVEQGNVRIRKITPAAVVSTVAGTGTIGNVDGVGGSFRNLLMIVITSTGNLWVSDYDPANGFQSSIRYVTVSTGEIRTLNATGALAINPTSLYMIDPTNRFVDAMAIDPADTLYLINQVTLSKIQNNTITNISLGFTNIIGAIVTSQYTLVTFGSDSIVRRFSTGSLTIGAATVNTLVAGSITASAAATVSSLNAGSGAITTTGTLTAGATTVSSLGLGSGNITTTGTLTAGGTTVSSLTSTGSAAVTGTLTAASASITDVSLNTINGSKYSGGGGGGTPFFLNVSTGVQTAVITTVFQNNLDSLEPRDFCFDESGNAYVVNGSSTIRRYPSSGGAHSTFATITGQLTSISYYNGKLYVANGSLINEINISNASVSVFLNVGQAGLSVSGVEVDVYGTLFFTDANTYSVYKCPISTKVPSKLAGGANGLFDGTGASVTFAFGNTTIVIDDSANSYVNNFFQSYPHVRRISQSGVVTTLNSAYVFESNPASPLFAFVLARISNYIIVQVANNSLIRIPISGTDTTVTYTNSTYFPAAALNFTQTDLFVISYSNYVTRISRVFLGKVLSYSSSPLVGTLSSLYTSTLGLTDITINQAVTNVNVATFTISGNLLRGMTATQGDWQLKLFAKVSDAALPASVYFQVLDGTNVITTGSSTTINKTVGEFITAVATVPGRTYITSLAIKLFATLPATNTLTISVNEHPFTSFLNTTLVSSGEIRVFYTSELERMRIDASGNVGIGTTNPQQLLDISGGSARAVSFITTSDRRVKNNIQNISNALGIVKELRGVYFTRIGETQRDVGVIAQEVEEVLPEVVHTSGDDLKSVSYGNMVGVLVEAVKTLSERLETLEKKGFE